MPMLKLFAFEGAETDWIAANDQAEALRTLILHYGITGSDVAGSYESVSEVDPNDVEFYTDEVDAETEETIMTTASALIGTKTKPFLVGSTWE
jgi:hypothetical protein